MTEKNSEFDQTMSFKEKILRDLEEKSQASVTNKQEGAGEESLPLEKSELEKKWEKREAQIEEERKRDLLEKEANLKRLKAEAKAAQRAQEERKYEDSESRERRRQNKKNHKKKSLVKKIVGWITLILVLVLLLSGFFGYQYVTSALGPVDANDKTFVTVEIPEGSGNKYIASILQEKGLIKNAQIFNYYTKFKDYGNFQSGYYNFQKSMDLETIATTLQEGGTDTPQPPVVGKITIPEGYTIEQIAQAITVNSNSKKKEKTPYKAEEFLKTIKDEKFIQKEVEKYPQLLASLPDKDSGVKYRLEGYLFPATYNYGEATSMEELIDQMLQTMDLTLSPYYDTIANKNLTVNEVLTLASLVEKEGATDKDRKDIASTFYNRLNQNMPLQSNIAILYAEGKLGQKTSLAEDAAIDTNIDSPYNIYKNPGLMPGAVDSPGLSALEAVINPSKTDYLYFVANVETGEVFFAKTYEEHEKNVEEHVNSKLSSN